MVTSLPNRARVCASSMPIGPAPISTSLFVGETKKNRIKDRKKVTNVGTQRWVIKSLQYYYEYALACRVCE